MNQGIFGFPAVSSNTIISTTEIDVSGSYRIAPGTKRLIIFAIGGGSGGGAGGRRASGVAQSGGGGGGQGAIVIQSFNVEDLGGVNTTLSIIIGAGSAGGIGSSNNNGSGAESLGITGTTTITQTGKPGVLISCLGGGNGGGGSTGTPSVPSIKTGFINGMLATNVYATNTASGAGASVTVLNMRYCCGAQGGGIAIDPIQTSGGNISVGTPSSTSVSNPNFASTVYTGGKLIATLVTPVNSTDQVQGKMSPGYGGPGGGSGVTENGQNGGNGYRGSGGGGGGSVLNGFTAGSGGAGGNGYVCIVAIK